MIDFRQKHKTYNNVNNERLLYLVKKKWIPQSTINFVTKGTKESFHIHLINNSLLNETEFLSLGSFSKPCFATYRSRFCSRLCSIVVIFPWIFISSDSFSLEIHQNHGDIPSCSSFSANVTFLSVRVATVVAGDY